MLPRSPLAGRRALPEAGGDVYPADAAAVLLRHPPRGSDWRERYGSVFERSCHAISVPEPQAARSPAVNSPCSHQKPPAPFCRRTRRPCRPCCCKSRQGKGRRRRARAHSSAACHSEAQTCYSQGAHKRCAAGRAKREIWQTGTVRSCTRQRRIAGSPAQLRGSTAVKCCQSAALTLHEWNHAAPAANLAVRGRVPVPRPAPPSTTGSCRYVARGAWRGHRP